MGKIAFVFAGQGAQHQGMGRELYETNAAARRVMNEAELIRPGTLDMCFSEDGKEALNQTIHTQPCMYMVDYACAEALRDQGIYPDCVAGFSLGEIAAAAFAGAMTFEEGFRLVVRRAELMQKCAETHQGGMVAVLRLSEEEVDRICAQFYEIWPVNYNCPGQIVVACSAKELEMFLAGVKRAGGRAVRLNVSGPFHSPYMQEASEKLYEYLSVHPLRKSSMPIYANKTARPYDGDWNELLAMQASSPVRWQQTIENMQADGIVAFAEVGAGRTLTGLIGKIDSSLITANVSDSASLAAAFRIFKEAAK